MRSPPSNEKKKQETGQRMKRDTESHIETAVKVKTHRKKEGKNIMLSRKFK